MKITDDPSSAKPEGQSPVRARLRPPLRLRLFMRPPLVLTLCLALFLAVGVSACNPAANPAAGPASREQSTDQKVEDFRYLFSVIKENYPYLSLKARTDGYDWVAHEQEFLEAVRKAASDEEFAKAIYRMVRLLNNGHTNLSPGGQNRSYAQWGQKPWKDQVAKTTSERADYWCGLAGASWGSGSLKGTEPFVAIYSAGDYVVVDVAPDQRVQGKVSPGDRVVSIGGKPVHEYVKAQYGETWLKLDPLRKINYEKTLILQTPGAGALSGDTVKIAFEALDGKVTEVNVPLKVDAWTTRYSWPPPYPFDPQGRNGTRNLYTAMIGGKAGYVRIRQMLSDPDADMAVLRQFMKTAGSLPALIVDIRGNGGGSDNYCWTLVRTLSPEPADLEMHLAWRASDFIRAFAEAKGMTKNPGTPKDELAKLAAKSGPPGLPPEILTPAFDEPRTVKYTIEPKNSVNYRGRIFLLVDDNVFSSAESFAAFCKGSGWATVVGGCTGGDGIGFDPALVTLPNSGMTVRFSSMMGLNPDWTANEEAHTHPDVLVEMTREDWVAYVNAWLRGLAGPDPAWDRVLRECVKMVG